MKKCTSHTCALDVQRYVLVMKTATKTQADLDNEALDEMMTESDREYWKQAEKVETDRG